VSAVHHGQSEFFFNIKKYLDNTNIFKEIKKIKNMTYLLN
jgi:hypothetical protein